MLSFENARLATVHVVAANLDPRDDTLGIGRELDLEERRLRQIVERTHRRDLRLRWRVRAARGTRRERHDRLAADRQHRVPRSGVQLAEVELHDIERRMLGRFYRSLACGRPQMKLEVVANEVATDQPSLRIERHVLVAVLRKHLRLEVAIRVRKNRSRCRSRVDAGRCAHDDKHESRDNPHSHEHWMVRTRAVLETRLSTTVTGVRFVDDASATAGLSQPIAWQLTTRHRPHTASRQCAARNAANGTLRGIAQRRCALDAEEAKALRAASVANVEVLGEITIEVMLREALRGRGRRARTISSRTDGHDPKRTRVRFGRHRHANQRENGAPSIVVPALVLCACAVRLAQPTRCGIRARRFDAR